MERGALDPHEYDSSLPRTNSREQEIAFDRSFREMCFRQFNLFPNDASSLDVKKYMNDLWDSGGLPKYKIVSAIEVEGLEIEFTVVEPEYEDYK